MLKLIYLFICNKIILDLKTIWHRISGIAGSKHKIPLMPSMSQLMKLIGERGRGGGNHHLEEKGKNRGRRKEEKQTDKWGHFDVDAFCFGLWGNAGMDLDLIGDGDGDGAIWDLGINACLPVRRRRNLR
jgi:hypothetical protein